MKIDEIIKNQKKYEAVKRYCLLSKKNSMQDGKEWIRGFEKVKKAQDNLRKILGGEFLSIIIVERDELIEKFGWENKLS